MRDKTPRGKRATIEDPNRIADDDPWAPPRTESYRVSGGKFIRFTMFGLIALAVIGAFAYSQYNAPRTAQTAPKNQFAQAETAPLPASSPLNYSAPPAPAPEFVPPSDPKPAPRTVPTPAAPEPAPLAGPSAAPMDVDPTTPATPTPIPEQAPQ